MYHPIFQMTLQERRTSGGLMLHYTTDVLTPTSWFIPRRFQKKSVRALNECCWSLTFRVRMSKRKRSRLRLRSRLGNFIEWFDYATYTYFAITIGQVFFPDSSVDSTLYGFRNLRSLVRFPSAWRCVLGSW